ncbi:MAG: ABC transporter permease, partial [Proteobacteria bacterium]|nr:ABC transporter permease [Pseudomonadota bacterium]
LLTVCLFAELVANDKPIIVKYDGKFYFPIINSSIIETTFGGDFETPTDYKDPYVQTLIKDKGWMIFPIIPYSYSTISYSNPDPAPSAPSKYNILGTDDNGRDVMARIIYGLRISLLFGLTLTAISAVIGVIMGALQGYFGGLFDLAFQRFMEIWSGLPMLFLLIILSSIIEPNFWILLSIMLLFSWMSLVGMVRAEFLKVRNYDFVKSARAIGSGNVRIIFKHILPNALSSSIATLPFLLSGSVVTLTSLDFLGFGMPIESPSLGELLAQGKNNINAYWLGISGFMVVTTICSLLVFIGEAVRNSLDIRS